MASCTASSAEDAVQEAMIAAFTQWPQEGIPETASDSAEHLRRKLTQQMLGSRIPFLGHWSSRYSISGGGPLMTWRTSIGMFNGTPPGPGAADALAAIS